MKKLFVMTILLFAALQYNIESMHFSIKNTNQGNIINITVIEAWEMLQNEEDGIQYPIDVRTFIEYFNERITTPHFYDKPILFPLQLIEKPFFMKLFIAIFEDKEIILYCRSANRSYIAAKLLIENGYEGTLYNMIGGIKAWKEAGLPTVKGFGFVSCDT